MNKKFDFPLSNKAVEINQKMTFDVLLDIKKKFNKKIKNKKVLLIGVSYKEDTKDTRYSPAEGVFNFLKKLGCRLNFYDPVVNYWDHSKDKSIEKKDFKNFDVYVHLVKHSSFKKLDFPYKKKSLILDLNHVLDKNKKLKISKSNQYVGYFIGSK